MSIRRLVPADAATYRALMLEAYARHPDAFTSSVAERAALPIAWWESRLREADNAPSIVLADFDADRIVGVAGLSFDVREKARHKATLFGMYVPIEHRRRGIGERLVLATLDCARERPHVKLVQLTVSDGNDAALALYERCGFARFGLEPFAVAVGGAYVSKIHMWCNLRCGG